MIPGPEQQNETAEIAAALQNASTGLTEAIVRDVGRFTIALLTVSRVRGNDYLDLGGTGTLIRFGADAYIFTAAHVWEKKLKNADRIGITLKENLEHKYLIDPNVIAASISEPRESDEWGPDLAFLRIPPQLAAEIEAVGHGVFYNLGKHRKPGFAGYCIELRLLMGTPKESGQVTDTHADLQIAGMFSDVYSGRFSSLVLTNLIRREYDYLDLDMKAGFLGVPQNLGGVSGGGLWRILAYKSAETDKVHWAMELEGIAFHQSDLVNGHRTVRCHGPQSIGTSVRLLLN